MTHAPAMHRAGLIQLVVKPPIRQENAEAEINGGQIRQEFPFIVLAGRLLSRGCQEIMGELVRQRGNQMIGPLEQSRNVADHDAIAGNTESAERMLLRSDHRQ